MAERLQKILSARGVASRRKAEEMIQNGQVTVNGVTAKLGDTADADTDEILVDGKALPKQDGFVYILLHKPRGYVTTLSDEKGRPNAAQLVDCGQRVYPVGRLDMDSEGLLIFTNDGEFAQRLAHPSHETDKTYRAYVTGWSEEAVERVKEPIVLDGYRIRPPHVVSEAPGRLRITIHEGRNRQVRRMCQAAGMQVTRLIRIGEGKLRLGDLPRGKWRELTPEEIKLLTDSRK
jgi:23S rRNA pseudouridine2605 synthase